MSRRAKFAFITWIGPSVSPLKKAAVSTDKAFVKDLWPVSLNKVVLNSVIFDFLQTFGKEILADEKKDVQYDTIKNILEKASGAAYGTGRQLSQLRFHGNESMLPVYNFMKIIAIFSSSEFVRVQFNFSSSKKF